MKQRIRVGIVGFRGYSGAELVRLLEHHPSVEIVLLEHRSDAGDKPNPIGSRQLPRIPCSAGAVGNEQLSLLFLATPPEISMELAPDMLAAGAKVIDLSGAFRLGSPAAYQRWYKQNHTAPDLFNEAVYGLPEINRNQLSMARLIANPGCYPTAANL